MENSLFMEHFIFVVVIVAAMILFLFFARIIGAFIFAAYTQFPDSMNVSSRLKCLCGFHQGAWTKIGCYQRRYCISCGELQDREKHLWPSRVGVIAGFGDLSFKAYAGAYGEYFQDGSGEKRVACLVCKEHKSIGKDHEGPQHWWSSRCKRCVNIWAKAIDYATSERKTGDVTGPELDVLRRYVLVWEYISLNSIQV